MVSAHTLHTWAEVAQHPWIFSVAHGVSTDGCIAPLMSCRFELGTFTLRFTTLYDAFLGIRKSGSDECATP